MQKKKAGKRAAYNMMLNLDPYEKIKEIAGDGSGTYDALADFLSGEGKKRYEEVKLINEELKNLREEKTEIEQRVAHVTAELDELKIESMKILQDQKRLTDKNAELVSENKRLIDQNRQMAIKGVDDEVNKLLIESDLKDKPELIKRILTTRDYSNLVDEIAEENLKLEKLKSEIDEADEQKTAIVTEINRLVEEKERISENLDAFQSVAAISEKAMNYGYGPVIFEKLLKAIEAFYELTPGETNRRIIEALAEYKSLQQIKGETAKAQSENMAIRDQLVRTKGEYDAISDKTLVELQSISSTALKQIEANRVAAEKILQSQLEMHEALQEKTENRLQKMWDNLVEKNETWEHKLKQIGEQELLLRNSLALASAYYDPSIAGQLNKQDIIRLAYIVNAWTIKNAANQRISPTRNYTNNTGLFTYTAYQLDAITGFQLEALRSLRE